MCDKILFWNKKRQNLIEQTRTKLKERLEYETKQSEHIHSFLILHRK